MSMLKIFDVAKPTDWTAEQKSFVTDLLKLRKKHPGFSRLLTLKLIGRLIAKTPGQMNRFSTDFYHTSR